MSRAFHGINDPILNPSTNPSLEDLLASPGRRTLLKGSFAALAGLLGVPGGAALASGPHRGFKPIPVGIDDALHVPQGYDAKVLVAWGDPIGIPGAMPAFRFDASNSADEQAVQSGTHHDGMHFFPLPPGSNNSTHGLLVINHEYPDHSTMFPDGRRNWSLEKVKKSQAALGCSVQEIRLEDGRWQMVRPSRFARRVHANTEMRIGGPAAGHPLMRTAQSPEGTRAFGTFNNCANGWTPWGTYLTCEENFSFHFKPPADPNTMEERYALTPWVGFSFNWGELDPRFDVARNRNEPNHHGWVVEIDPYDPQAQPVKRTALGRMSHECAVPAICNDGRVAFYTDDDRVFEYLYKFISANPWNPDDRAANRDLLDTGTLYVARFNADGSGDWLELTHGKNGLTPENGFDSQAAVVMFARAAGDRVGATKMDRPEWIAVHPQTKDVYCTLTNNGARGAGSWEDATPANPRAPNRYGHILRWSEAGGDHAATRFRWEIFVLAGNPNHAAAAQHGNIKGDLFASPDSLMIDARGALWVQTDISPGRLHRGDHALFGNNQMLVMDPVTREARRFLTGPRGCEVTGACMTPDGRTLFVNMQHPGEPTSTNHPRQTSNWPDYRADGRPRSGTVAIRRTDGGIVGT